MTTITLGENGALILPEALRNGLRLHRGAKLEAALIGDHIELKPCGKIAPDGWPPGFFDRIAIDDPASCVRHKGRCRRVWSFEA